MRFSALLRFVLLFFSLFFLGFRLPVLFRFSLFSSILFGYFAEVYSRECESVLSLCCVVVVASILIVCISDAAGG